jgi:hypothetical protein
MFQTETRSVPTNTIERRLVRDLMVNAETYRTIEAVTGAAASARQAHSDGRAPIR